MRFAIFTHVPHFESGGHYYAYTPYIREMNIWLQFADEVEVVAPLSTKKDHTDTSYNHKKLVFTEISSINLLNFSSALMAIFRIPVILFQIISVMRRADHLHIRCPGNIGLLASIAQMFFPKKPKTVKYAGNWDRESAQPRSYKFQKWILSNTSLTRNAKVLVYGNWLDTSENIVPFFTASLSEQDKEIIEKDFESPYKFIFVGNLVEEKGVFSCLEIIQELKEMGHEVKLIYYGNGPLKSKLKKFIEIRGFANNVMLKGNIPLEELKRAYKKSHFCLLPSQSEGWPKAVAEAMFYGCIPVASQVSCIPWMLDQGKRGVLIDSSINSAVKKIELLIKNPEKMADISRRAQVWSQEYTLEKFRKEIKKLV
tara:strand:- start:7 stop:1113 length:1107 start_codon:yes stop_codon:yes gene_type:complete